MLIFPLLGYNYFVSFIYKFSFLISVSMTTVMFVIHNYVSRVFVSEYGAVDIIVVLRRECSSPIRSFDDLYTDIYRLASRWNYHKTMAIRFNTSEIKRWKFKVKLSIDFFLLVIKYANVSEVSHNALALRICEYFGGEWCRNFHYDNVLNGK